MNATESYKKNRELIDAEIKRIQENLKEMDAAQAADDLNWGFSGSAGLIENRLHDIARISKLDNYVGN